MTDAVNPTEEETVLLARRLIAGYIVDNPQGVVSWVNDVPELSIAAFYDLEAAIAKEGERMLQSLDSEHPEAYEIERLARG